MRKNERVELIIIVIACAAWSLHVSIATLWPRIVPLTDVVVGNGLQVSNSTGSLSCERSRSDGLWWVKKPIPHGMLVIYAGYHEDILFLESLLPAVRDDWNVGCSSCPKDKFWHLAIVPSLSTLPSWSSRDLIGRSCFNHIHREINCQALYTFNQVRNIVPECTTTLMFSTVHWKCVHRSC